MLLVRSRHDRLCPPGWLERLAGSTGTGVTASLAAGAHMVPLARPRELAAQVRTFRATRAKDPPVA